VSPLPRPFEHQVCLWCASNGSAGSASWRSASESLATGKPANEQLHRQHRRARATALGRLHGLADPTAHADDSWETVATRDLDGSWVAIFQTRGKWRTVRVHTLILEVHPDGRSRVVIARRRRNGDLVAARQAAGRVPARRVLRDLV